MDKTIMEETVYSVLFVAGEAVSLYALAALCEIDPDEFRDEIDKIIEKQINEKKGIIIRRFGEQLRLSTNKEYSSSIKKLFAPDVTEKLSNTVLETLSVIAYRQPVTRAEVEAIRGVRCEYTINMLIEKGMVREAGRKDVIGRPILYATTDDFLEHFGITGLDELPQIGDSTAEDIQELQI